MSLRSPTENEITLTPGSSPGQALALSPFDDVQGRRWNGRGNFFRTKERQTHFFFLSSPACGRGEGEGPAEYDISKECSMMLRSPTENENADPKFTDQVQHFLYKVLRWDRSMNSFHWNNVVPLPGIAKPGKQSAKSRQLWIARHRL